MSQKEVLDFDTQSLLSYYAYEYFSRTLEQRLGILVAAGSRWSLEHHIRCPLSMHSPNPQRHVLIF